MGYSHEISTQRERAGQQLQAKIPLKELLTLSPGNVAEGS
jgi:hypothetical protein